MKKILLAYIPVLHKGYIDLISSEKFDMVCVIGRGIISEINMDYIKRKDSIRSISSEMIVSAIRSWNIVKEVREIDLFELETFKSINGVDIVLPDEDISHLLAEKYFPNKKVNFKSIFLRWHRNNVADQDMADNYQSILVSDFESEIMDLAVKEAFKSADWWRQIGAVLVKDKKVLFITHNKHLPDEQSPYVFGDPRSIFKRGVHVELSTSEHAEASIIAEAANKGVALKGTTLFTTDFPCPPCAKLIAHSGIKKMFFKNGYAVLDGASILKQAKVEVIRVKFD